MFWLYQKCNEFIETPSLSLPKLTSWEDVSYSDSFKQISPDMYQPIFLQNGQ